MSWFTRGWFRVGAWNGVPVYLHWSAPVGALLFGGLGPTYGDRAFVSPGGWLAFVIVVLVHEIGHAAAVVRFAGGVRAIRLWALGGECEFAGYFTELQRIIIAWAGIIAQVVLATVVILLARGKSLTWLFAEQLFMGLVVANLIMAVLNLIPMGRLDGRTAWRIVPYAFRRLSGR